MSNFSMTLPAVTWKSGRHFPAITKSFDTGFKLWEWWEKESNRRKEKTKKKRRRTRKTTDNKIVAPVAQEPARKSRSLREVVAARQSKAK